MKKLVVGILAHVDAGKTTLSEGLLYLCGALKKLGRVDHQTAFLDTDFQERERGITIFSKQAILTLDELEITLLDTPGHVDFSSEMERTLQILDYAILVISGSDGIQGHTRTLWRLLQSYRIPTFLFVNKIDLAGVEPSFLMEQLRRLDEGCVRFDGDQSLLFEQAALCDEGVLERYLADGTVTDGELAALIRERKLFPCYFGSALKLEGVAEFLAGLARYTIPPRFPASFGARVFKISRDPQGNRLTHVKITGGFLKVKAPLSGPLASKDLWSEKVDQIRIYSGAKFRTVDQVEAGTVCAVTGLSYTYPGQGLGEAPPAQAPMLEPVLTYQVILPPNCDPHSALSKLKLLEEEDPQLHVVWSEALQEIHLQLMGEIQLEVLRRLLEERFGLAVSFGPGNIVYRETILSPVEGVGHYEPLRHYAEVHLLLEPGPRGSGLQLDSRCPEDMLDRNWQRLVLTHLAERIHPGVLTGSPLTDVKITLIAGRAHAKHTEGGDFRQATYRAVRQGLMQADCQLLEPWYQFQLELPTEYVGRAMADLQRMGGEISPPEHQGGDAVLTGSAPVARLRSYPQEVAAYTKGQGRLFFTLKGYEPCHHQQEVIDALGYDSQRDTDNPADSIFCTHGAGFVVKWDQVKDYMHVESPLKSRSAHSGVPAPPPRAVSSYSSSLEQDKELRAIFERTYGPIRRKDFLPQRKPPRQEPAFSRPKVSVQNTGPEYLLVDGYNIIFAWEELKAVAQDNLDAARQMLMDILSNYQGFQKSVVILVFDAYKVPRSVGEVIKYHNIYVVYTKEAETADAYIERATYQIGTHHRVKVATSDAAEQLIILGHGALRLSASAFRSEIERVSGEIAAVLSRNNRREASRPIKAALERAGGGISNS